MLGIVMRKTLGKLGIKFFVALTKPQWERGVTRKVGLKAVGQYLVAEKIREIILREKGGIS
jgi:hypothetical protein